MKGYDQQRQKTLANRARVIVFALMGLLVAAFFRAQVSRSSDWLPAVGIEPPSLADADRPAGDHSGSNGTADGRQRPGILGLDPAGAGGFDAPLR